MAHFTDSPEALDFVAHQGWLSPDEDNPARSMPPPAWKPAATLRPLEAWHHIKGILRRTSFRRTPAGRRFTRRHSGL